VRTSPSAVIRSIPDTAVARLPLASPDPWLAVAHAPATDRCGSDAMLRSAQPAASSCAVSSW
jgi:hypothetical protein